MRLHNKVCSKCGYKVPKGRGSCPGCGSTKMVEAGMRHSAKKLTGKGKSPAERIRDGAPSVYDQYNP